MSELWKNNKLIITAYSAVVIACLFILISYSKISIHLFINKINSPVADHFFKYITYLGDGIFVIIASILISFRKIKYGLYSLVVYASSGITVQLMKHLIWYNAERPAKLLENNSLHFIEGVKLHMMHSFPSGHTASAFGLCFVLIFLTRNKLLHVLLLICALLTGYSRMYLSQHFLIDVFTGSIIGAICPVLLYNIIINKNSKWLEFSIIPVND